MTTTETRPEICLGDAVPRLEAELAGGTGRILILSPYLTSDIAQSLLVGREARICEIFTLFTAEVFARHASSISTLRTLAEADYQLFELPDLHAKVVLDIGRSVAIGSQNMTLHGSHSKEATVLLTDDESISAVEAGLKPWLEERRRITLEMITEMEAAVPPIEELFEAAHNKAIEIDETIRQNESLRQQERAREWREFTLRRLRFRQELERLPRSTDTTLTRVKRMQHRWPTWTWTLSLAVTENGPLTEWQLDNQKKVLSRLQRYLCFVARTGKISWVRLGKTRITFIERSLRRADQVLMASDIPCGLTFVALWDDSSLKTHNLEVVIDPRTVHGFVEARAWVSPDSVQFSEFQLKPENGKMTEEGLRTVRAWILNNKADFERRILSSLLQPFKYQEKLTGVEAVEFFGPEGTEYRLQLAKLQDQLILVAE